MWKSNPHADLIESKLEEYLSTRSKLDVERDFSDHKMAAQTINEFEDVLADPHIAARDTFITWENMDGEEIKGLNTFPKFTRHPGDFWRPMPRLGQDTQYLLERAGFTEEEIDRFVANGTVKRDEN